MLLILKLWALYMYVPRELPSSLYTCLGSNTAFSVFDACVTITCAFLGDPFLYLVNLLVSQAPRPKFQDNWSWQVFTPLTTPLHFIQPFAGNFPILISSWISCSCRFYPGTRSFVDGFTENRNLMKFFTTATMLSFSCNSENYLDLSSRPDYWLAVMGVSF